MTNTLSVVIVEALRSLMNLPESETISLESSLREDLGLDSMSTLSFLMVLEEKIDGFVVDPDTLDANDLKTVGSVMNYITRENLHAA